MITKGDIIQKYASMNFRLITSEKAKKGLGKYSFLERLFQNNFIKKPYLWFMDTPRDKENLTYKLIIILSHYYYTIDFREGQDYMVGWLTSRDEPKKGRDLSDGDLEESTLLEIFEEIISIEASFYEGEELSWKRNTKN